MHYLDHACFGPPAPPTQRAVLEALKELTSIVHRDATELALEWLRQRERARSAVASLLDSTSADITLVESTTHGMGIVAGGLQLRPGDNVVVGDCDFIGLPTVWRTQERRGVELRAATSQRGRLTLESIRHVVDARTRVLAFSAVQEVSGVPLDVAGVAEIAASVGAYLMLDGIQEAGVITRDPARHGIHAYASGGHKWLRAPYGIGFLWTSPSLRAALTPPFQGYFAMTPPEGGWRAHLADPTKTALEPADLRDDGAALELGGTPNWPGAVGLGEAVRGLLEQGPRAVELRARTLANRLRDELLSRGIAPMTPVGAASTIVTFSLSPAVSDNDVVARAQAAGIRLSARGSAGAQGVRVSCHGDNTDADIEALLEVVDNLQERSRSRR